MSDKNISNLINLKTLEINNILEVLQLRYKNNKIYTKINQIILALNPFKKIKTDFKDPHPDELALYCYQDMIKQKKNHSILVSGESGAGKTETTKILLKKLLSLSDKHTDLLEQIYWSNYILEAFGNAKTIRNHNSSRFGKFINIYFDNGEIIGAKIETYLLEKIRVTRKNKMERNYHIFYMLYPELLKTKFMNNNCAVDENLNDEESLFELHQAFKFFKMSEDKFNEIKNIIKIIILFGDFKNNYHEISILLKVSEQILLKKINYKIIKIGSEIIEKNLNENEIKIKIETLCEELYSKLFENLVVLINKELLRNIKTTDNLQSISLLDIFGFEILQDNSIEQLCINYTNEILQNTFNQYFFEKEQEIYLAEGLPYNLVVFENNNNIIDDIENNVFKIINDTSKFIKGKTSQISDNLFKIKNNTINISNLQKAKDMFSVNHYADTVEYNLEEFLLKNKQDLPDDIISLFQESKISLVKNFCFIKSKHTLLESFKKQIFLLKSKINTTKVNFIRCIKPNDKMLPLKLDVLRTKEQLKYNGVIEAIRVARQGYPVRIKNIIFDKMYKMIDLTKLSNLFIRGKTITFMTKENEIKLDNIKKEILDSKALLLQKTFRCYYQKNKFIKIKKIIIKIQSIIKMHLQFNKFKIIQKNNKVLIIQKNYKCYINYKKYKIYKLLVLWTTLKRKLILKQREKNKKAKVILHRYIINNVFKNRVFKLFNKIKLVKGFIKIYLAKKEKIRLKKDSKDINKLKEKLLFFEHKQELEHKLELQHKLELEQKLELEHKLKLELEKQHKKIEIKHLENINKLKDIEKEKEELNIENTKLAKAILDKDCEYINRIIYMERQMEKLQKELENSNKVQNCVIM